MPNPSFARIGVAVLGVAALLGSACSGGSSGSSGSSSSDDGGSGGQASGDAEQQAIYPADEWSRVEPAVAGFDPVALFDIAAEAEQARSNCLLVVRHGQLVAEWYWNGTEVTTSQEVFSATKSYTSTLVGMAQADGDLDIADPASEHIPEWAGTDSAEVTVEDLISNDSGRLWDIAVDYRDLVAAPDRTGFAVGLSQEAPPGSTWAYNNAAIQTLDAVLESATGEEPADYAQERLLEPVGMAHSEMTRDRAGNTNMFFGLQSTCQDMARFGYLFLRQGNWDGEQVVAEDWVEAATGQPSQELNAAYGYLWWLNRRGPIASPLQPTTGQPGGDVADGQLVPGAPEDMYWAVGLGGQVIQIDPGSDTVVVRLGPGDRSVDYGAPNTARVVTEALVEP
jgi:CubicO group peptidase (beta-lactamase class C family)